MKKVIPFTLLIALFCLLGCGEQATETEEPEMEVGDEGSAVEELSTLHVVYFTTADYAVWRQNYKEVTGDKNLLGIFENLDEPGQFMLAERNEGHDAAREFFESPKFDSIIASVATEVAQIIYMNAKFSSDADNSTVPYRLAVGHEVSDYAMWEEKFFADDASRKEMGVSAIALSTDNQNPNMVYVWLGVDDIEKAKNMVGAEEMKAKMADAGVVGEPQALWWKPVDAGS